MTGRAAWRFSPDEFAWVWSAETGQDYPYPIDILESPSTDLDTYSNRRHSIAALYPRGADADLSRALRTLYDPELRIMCTGQVHASGHRVRCLAVADSDYGVLLHQLPGPTAEFGGGLELVVTHRTNLSRGIVATMPAAVAGKLPRMIGYTPRVRGDEPPTTYFVQSDGRGVVETRIRSLLRAPRAAEGHICIELDVRRGQRYPPHFMNWLDIRVGHRAAGRYLIDVGNDTVVDPASVTHIADELTRRAQL
ncbi:ESX secretion-associated protein EspG [Nocardia salmonicida]|uniref:ESX secretion-associated protein EspG n=1 Tax=Nocardia salmonicida TaxID=53431 RepID=UPI0007A3B3A2|nr:ESX secretion-associated protein EspG [Nocardia salmonicida]